MPRVLVIGIFVVLVLGIVVGASVLVWQNFTGTPPEATEEEGSDQTGNSLFKALPATEQAAQKEGDDLVSDVGDDDSDGLTNGDELVWGTDKNNPDTDGDGYLDGEEVAAGHDPNKPAPDDLLAATQTPVATQEPAVSQGGLSLKGIEQYLVEDLDISGGTKNLTEEYKQQYAEEDRSSAVRLEYAQAQSIVSQLPKPDESNMPDTVESTRAAIDQYLRVADNKNALANSTSYSQARFELYSQKNPALMRGLARTVQAYRNQLLTVSVPETALPVHLILLGYTELLVPTFEQIALWNEDPVKSMVASRQLEVIDRKYYPIIQEELQRLEAMQR